MSKKLILSSDGIFPIIKDANGEFIKRDLKTNLTTAGTVQGEGKYIGEPSLFIRLAGCNLKCKWTSEDGFVSECDTAYANEETENNTCLEVEDIIKIIKNNIGSIKHIVITGGEPLLQKEALIDLCYQIKKQFNLIITIESNSSISPKGFEGLVDLFSISPKLNNAVLRASGNTPEYCVQEYIDMARNGDTDLQIKFVVSKTSDDNLIKAFLSDYTSYKQSDIMVMPAGTNMEQLNKTSKIALEISIKNGWRFTHRLHIILFGDEREV